MSILKFQKKRHLTHFIVCVIKNYNLCNCFQTLKHSANITKQNNFMLFIL